MPLSELIFALKQDLHNDFCLVKIGQKHIKVRSAERIGSLQYFDHGLSNILNTIVEVASR